MSPLCPLRAVVKISKGDDGHGRRCCTAFAQDGENILIEANFDHCKINVGKEIHVRGLSSSHLKHLAYGTYR